MRIRLLLVVFTALLWACDPGPPEIGPGASVEPCPIEGEDDADGCIRLGVVAELDGPGAGASERFLHATQAFWATTAIEADGYRYHVDPASHVGDAGAEGRAHRAAYDEVAPHVAALGLSVGQRSTGRLLEALHAGDLVALPAAGQLSLWAADPRLVSVGASTCAQAAHAVDFVVDRFGDAVELLVIHQRGPAGGDAVAGAEHAASQTGVDLEVRLLGVQEADLARSVDAVASQRPDAVVLATGPSEAAQIVAQSTARGYAGLFVGLDHSWDPQMLDGPAATALSGRFLLVMPWGTFGADTREHRRMRAALGEVQPHDGYTAAWVRQHALRALFEEAVARRDLTRAGLVAAAAELDAPDTGGMAPSGAVVVHRPDHESDTGLTIVDDDFGGPSAGTVDEPCLPVD